MTQEDNMQMLLETEQAFQQLNQSIYDSFAQEIRYERTQEKKRVGELALLNPIWNHMQHLSPTTLSLVMSGRSEKQPARELCFISHNAQGSIVFTRFNLHLMLYGGLSPSEIFRAIEKEYQNARNHGGGMLMLANHQINRVQKLIELHRLELENGPSTQKNYSFLMEVLAHPVTKILSVILIIASLLLLGLVTAGIGTIPVMAGSVLAAVGIFSGTGMYVGQRWAMQQSSDKHTMHDQPAP